MDERPPLIVKCPSCKKRGAWFALQWGPFCSERCRLMDLGRWFNEEHRVSRELRPGDFEGFDEISPGPSLDQPEG